MSESDGDAELYVVSGDGAPVRLTDNDWDDHNATLSPDGRRLLFDADPGGNRDVYVMDLDGSGTRRVTTSPSSDREPAWSPRGDRIAFISDRSGRDAVYLLDAAVGEPGAAARQLTAGHQDSRPSWHDGTIAYRTVRSGSFEIWYVRPDAEPDGVTGLPTARQFTSGEGGHHAPEWSPDGTLLASVERRVGGWVRVVARDSSGGPDVRYGTPDDLSGPTWSPNGRYLAFAASETIVIRDLIDGSRRELSLGLGDISEPDWGVDPSG